MSHRLCKNCRNTVVRPSGMLWCRARKKPVKWNEEACIDPETGVSGWEKREYQKLSPEERHARLSAAGKKGGAKSRRGKNRISQPKDLVMVWIHAIARDRIRAYAKANGRTFADVIDLYAVECQAHTPPPPAPKPA